MCNWALLNLKNVKFIQLTCCLNLLLCLKHGERVLRIGPRPLGWDVVRNFSPPVPDKKWVSDGSVSVPVPIVGTRT
jgi:hypothetical protein